MAPFPGRSGQRAGHRDGQVPAFDARVDHSRDHGLAGLPLFPASLQVRGLTVADPSGPRDPDDEAAALNEAGTLYWVRGYPTKAAACHRQALAIARKSTAPWHEANALAGLGRCAQADGAKSMLKLP